VTPMDSFSRRLDILIRPKVRLFHRPWPAFQVCGYLGLALSILLAMSLVSYLGLSLGVTLGITAAAVLSFFALVMAGKILTGEEQIIYYHHQIAVIIVITLLLRSLNKPVLPYLDVTILGIGLFLVFGRVGCLMVGCCHGRPYRLGVSYRPEHADAGFTPYFVGVRLFPVQAVESLWVLGIVLVGVVLVLHSYPPGTALTWYVVMYGVGRFCLEFMRGDPGRSYPLGFTQPQWTSFLLMSGLVWAELTGILPRVGWHIVATISVAGAMIGVSLKRRLQKTAKHQLLQPRHVKEVAETLAMVSNSGTQTLSTTGRWRILPAQGSTTRNILIGSTSLGIQISAGRISDSAGETCHYTLSRAGGGMTEETARVLGRLIFQLKQAAGAFDLVKGSRDVFHLVIHPVSGKESAHR